MLKPPDHDARRNTNFSGKCLDRRLAEIRFSHKLVQAFSPNQRIFRECVIPTRPSLILASSNFFVQPSHLLNYKRQLFSPGIPLFPVEVRKHLR